MHSKTESAYCLWRTPCLPSGFGCARANTPHICDMIYQLSWCFLVQYNRLAPTDRTIFINQCWFLPTRYAESVQPGHLGEQTFASYTGRMPCGCVSTFTTCRSFCQRTLRPFSIGNFPFNTHLKTSEIARQLSSHRSTNFIWKTMNRT